MLRRLCHWLYRRYWRAVPHQHVWYAGHLSGRAFVYCGRCGYGQTWEDYLGINETEAR